jgi:hypothetical protein
MGTMKSFIINEENHGTEAAQIVLRPENVWILIPASHHKFSEGYFCGMH